MDLTVSNTAALDALLRLMQGVKTGHLPPYAELLQGIACVQQLKADRFRVVSETVLPPELNARVAALSLSDMQAFAVICHAVANLNVLTDGPAISLSRLGYDVLVDMFRVDQNVSNPQVRERIRYLGQLLMDVAGEASKGT